jgi:hypothetical protein
VANGGLARGIDVIRILAGVLWLLLAAQSGANPCVIYENNFDAPVPVGGGPVEVHVRLYMNDLTEIKDAEQSFVSDVFFRVEWLDTRMAHRGPEPCSAPLAQVWNPQLQVLNRRVVDRVKQPELVVFPNGTVRQVVRAYGDFSFRADLTNFPFDQQQVGFTLVSSLGPEAVMLVAKPENLGLAEHLSVANWVIEPLGSRNSEYYIAPVELSVSRLDIDFQATRLTGFYTWQLLLPLVLVVMMTWAVFWLPLEFVAPRVGLVATSMLTLIAYRFSMSSILPPIAYLTRLDKFMVASSVLVFSALAAAVAVTHLESSGRIPLATGLNAVSRYLAPLLFLVAIVMVFVA